MKLTWEYLGDTFSLKETDKAKCGYSVVCTSESPSDNCKYYLSSFQEAFMMCALESGSPSMPDFWDNMHGYLTKDEDVKILEAEPIEYPEDAVF